MRKMIFAASIEGAKKHMACAMYDGERLIVTHCEPLGDRQEAWMPQLLEDIRVKVEQGFVVLLEDRTGRLSPHATAFTFEEICENGRTYLQSCLDLYFSLAATGRLIFETGLERYALRQTEGGMIDTRHDEKGRVIYDVKWSEFDGGRRAMLMCVAGAFLEAPLSERWINALVDASDSETPRPKSWLDTWKTITAGADARAQADHEAARAATQRRIEENSHV